MAIILYHQAVKKTLFPMQRPASMFPSSDVKKRVLAGYAIQSVVAVCWAQALTPFLCGSGLMSSASR